MREFAGYHRKMLCLMAGACLVVAAALLVVMWENREWAGGFAVGAAAQLFKFGVLDIGVIRKIAVGGNGAATAQVKSMYAFLLILGAAAFLVYTLKLNPWAMLAGIVLPRLVLIADTYLRPNLFAPADAAVDGNGKGGEGDRE